MFVRTDYTLLTDLVQNGTRVLPGDFDEARLSPSGHNLTIDDTRYISPTDFTLSSDGSGDITLKWLNAATIVTGKILRLRIAYVDLIIGGTSDSGIADALANKASVGVVDGGLPYQVVAVSSAAVAIGASPLIGDALISIRWKAGATPTDIIILDNTTEVARITAAAQAANSQGVEWFGWLSKVAGGWHITTSTGSSALVVYRPVP